MVNKTHSAQDKDRSMTQWLYLDAGPLAYTSALDLQRRLVEAVRQGKFSDGVLILLEHPRVFTLGRRGGLEHLTVTRSFLAQQNIPVVQVERGGNITYHGPGQLVGYPIIALKRVGLGVAAYVEGLEEIMIRAAADFGVTADRDLKNRGIWIGPRKLGSIGIHVRRGITFHGFAFNVNLSLEPFQWMNPCGLTGIQATSLVAESGRHVTVNHAKERILRHIVDVFRVHLVPIDHDTVTTRLDEATAETT